MAEIILYRGSMPTVFFNQGDVDAAIASGNYRRQPAAATTQPSLHMSTEDQPIETAEQPKTGIDINTASLTELIQIDGIGLARGKEIIESRPYSAAEDLIAITEAVKWVELEKSGEIYFS